MQKQKKKPPKNLGNLIEAIQAHLDGPTEDTFTAFAVILVEEIIPREPASPTTDQFLEELMPSWNDEPIGVDPLRGVRAQLIQDYDREKIARALHKVAPGSRHIALVVVAYALSRHRRNISSELRGIMELCKEMAHA